MPAGPRLTRRMDRLKADLREHGFGMFEGALDPKTTARIRERVLEQGAAERRIGYGTTNLSVEPDDDVNQWVALLPNKGQVFRTLINNDRVLEIVRFILGEDAILSEFSAHVTWPGNKEMGLRPEVADDLTEHERALMGFKTWETYGTSDEFGAEWARPGKDNLGERR